MQFIELEYSWKNLSLYNFLLEGNVPIEYKDFFLENQDEIRKISDFLKEENCVIYPKNNHVFRAFTIPLNKVKVVILGMDPYHNGNAVGICFSVPPNVKLNPSLKNIYRELREEGYTCKEDGNLFHWVDQGCLMLNTALTVEKGKPDSHTKVWKEFTNRLLAYISSKNVVWLLMGNKALSFSPLIKGKIFVTSHPSPFSAHKGFRSYPAFLGSGVFKKINLFLKKKGEKCIKW